MAILERSGREIRPLINNYSEEEMQEYPDDILFDYLLHYGDIETEIDVDVISIMYKDCQTTVLPFDWEIDDDDVNKSTLETSL